MTENSVKKNFILQVVYQILLIIAPLITAPYIARVLGPERVGVNSYSYAITTYFVMVAALGIENYGSRMIAQTKHNKDELNKGFSELFLIHFVISTIVLALFFLFCFLFVKRNRIIFLIQSLYIIGVVFDVNWVFFGLEEFQRIIAKNCILKILSVISVFLFVRTSEDLISYVAILAGTTFLNYVVLWLGLRRYVRFVPVRMADCLVHIRPLVVLFLPSIAILLYKYMDKIMLGNMYNSASVGYYDSGERIITLILGVINALGVVMLPRVSTLVADGNKEKTKDYFNKSIVFVLCFAIGGAAGAIAIAADFVPLFFGTGYEPSVAVMEVLAITIPFSALANVVKSQYLLPNKFDNFFAMTLICGSLVNFTINILCIPIMGVLGAAIGTLVTEIFVCVVQCAKSNKSMHTFEQLAKCFGFVVPAAVMLVFIKVVRINNVAFIRIMLDIVFGGIIYIILSTIYLYFVDRKTVYEVCNIFKRWIKR